MAVYGALDAVVSLNERAKSHPVVSFYRRGFCELNPFFLKILLKTILVFNNRWTVYLWSVINHLHSFWWSCCSSFCVSLASSWLQVCLLVPPYVTL